MRLILITLWLCLTPVAAFAQTPPSGGYGGVGGALSWTHGMQPVNGGNGVRLIPTPMATVGWWVAPRLSIEATVARPIGEDVVWRFSHTSSTQKMNLAHHHDTLLMGSARVRAMCRGTMCVEPVVGAGVAIHHGESAVTGDCGTIVAPINPCQPATPFIAGQPVRQTHAIAAISGGADLRVRLNPHVDFLPSLRVGWIHHDELLERSGYAPVFRGRFALTFGASIAVR